MRNHHFLPPSSFDSVITISLSLELHFEAYGVAHPIIWDGQIGSDSSHDAYASVIVISKDEQQINLRINYYEKMVRCVKENQPSATAQRISMRRITHYPLYDQKVFDNSLAFRVISEEGASSLQADLRQFLAWCHHFGKTYSKFGLSLIK